MNKHLIVITGPTSIGKTSLSIKLAEIFNTEIVSADSRQVYRELKIGTAVPGKEELERVPHHFIGTQSIYSYYNASMYEQEVLKRLEDLFQRYSHVIMTGGSGLYIKAVCEGIDELPRIDADVRNKLIQQYQTEGIESLRLMLKRLDPVYYEKADLKNPKRLLKALEVCVMTGKPYSSFLTNPQKSRPFHILKIGLNQPREELHHIINKRVDQMIEKGLIEEAFQFYDDFKSQKLNALNTVGYKELFKYFDGLITRDEAIEEIKRNTRRYARRQITWFSKDKEIKWFHPDQLEAIKQYIRSNTINQ